MNQIAILYPVFVQVLLTFFVAMKMGIARSYAMPSLRKPGSSDLALGRVSWPDDAAKAAANYHNLLELPVLFYAVVAFALIAKGADLLMIVLAWAFVLSRIIHTVIHVGPNRIAWRWPVFAAGFVILAAMWLKLFLHVVTRGIVA